MADQVGSAQATPELLDMIARAQSNGLKVDTWGNPTKDRWGISYVAVRQADGSYKAYYDTSHKLALLQQFSSYR